MKFVNSTLFPKSINAIFLYFLNPMMEKKYFEYILKGNTRYDKNTIIILFVQIIVAYCLQMYEFITSISGHPRFNFRNELGAIIATSVAIIIEIIIYFINKVPWIRGCFLIFGYYVLTTQTSLNIITCFAFTIGDILVIICSIFIGIVYNKFFIYPTIAVFLGSLYFMILILMNATISIFQLILTIFTILCILFWNVFIFYNNERTLRKDFFLLELIRGKHNDVKHIVEEMPISILTKKTGKVNYLNSSLKELLGITKLEDKDFQALPKNERSEKYLNLLSEVKKENEEYTLVQCLNNESISIKQLSSFTFIKFINNNKIQLKIKGIKLEEPSTNVEVYVIEDITYLLRVQAQTEKKYQQIIVASVAHEILTPINGGMGMIDSLIPNANSKKVKKYLTIIQILFKKLIFFVNLLKEYSVIENNSLSITISEFNILESIDHCINLFEKDFKYKKLSITRNYEQPYMKIKCDQNKLSLIIFCLISNAAKHTFKGSITINALYLENNSKFEVSVEDTGCGIDQDTLQVLFTICCNSILRNELNPQGIGLQLYVCKKLIVSMKGTINVESKLGKGSKFSFILPTLNSSSYEHIDTLESPHSINLPLIQDRHFSNLVSLNYKDENLMRSRNPSDHGCACNKFLIVDDDATSIKVLKNYFKSINKECDSAFNGKIALEKVISQNSKQCCNGYELILMDLNMPVMDGEEATRLINQKMHSREIHPCNIIAISAAQILSTEHHNKFLDAGFKEIFPKPLSKETFNKIIAQYGPKEA